MTTPVHELEWYRVSVLWRVLLTWAFAVGLIFVGMVGTGLHLFAPPSLPETTRWVAGLLGWPSAICGPVLGAMGILRVLSGETRTLVVCTDGVRFEGFDGLAPVLWSDLVSFQPVGTWPAQHLELVARRAEGTRTVLLPARWMGHSVGQICARVQAVQKGALLGVPDRQLSRRESHRSRR